MPGYISPTYSAFGRSEYLRSTVGAVFESYTLAANSIPADASGNKVLQSGTVLATITSASGAVLTADIGKVGPFWRGAVTDSVQTVDLGGASAGTVTLTFDGATTAAIAYNASAATIKTALENLPNIRSGDITVTGGPFPAAVVVTFSGNNYAGKAQTAITGTPSGLTGGTITVAQTTAGGAAAGGAADGRQDPANIVGICDTFLPYQLNNFDETVAVLKRGRVYQNACYEYTGSELAPGTRGISNATKRDLTIPAYNDLDLMVF